MKKTAYIAAKESDAERLDTYISLKSGLSRSYVQGLLKQGLILVNSAQKKASYKIRQGDRIELTVPDEPAYVLIPQDITIDVLWEDGHIIVVNKPPGMVVYPAAGHRDRTLLNAVISRCRKLPAIGSPLRAGVVHRIDKDTSGVIVIAKDNAAYINLSRQFRDREVEKHYLALLYGSLKKDRGEISTAIGRAVSGRKKMSTRTKKGKEAITRYEVIERFKSATLAKVNIITGRTHQIRVHFSAMGNPVLGDRIYGEKTAIKFAQKTIAFSRQMLHAHSLKFRHPIDGHLLEFTAPMPEDMKQAIEQLSGDTVL